MSISGTLNKEKVAYIYIYIYIYICIYTTKYYAAIKKEKDYVLFRNMNGAGSHYPLQTNAGTENQILYALTCKWKLNDNT